MELFSYFFTYLLGGDGLRGGGGSSFGRCWWDEIRWWSQRLGKRGQTAVFFTSFFDHTTRNEVLELFVSAEAEHFLSTAGRIPGAQALVNNVEKLFKLEGCTFFGEGGNEFLGHEIRKPTRERTFSLHKHEK